MTLWFKKIPKNPIVNDGMLKPPRMDILSDIFLSLCAVCGHPKRYPQTQPGYPEITNVAKDGETSDKSVMRDSDQQTWTVSLRMLCPKLPGVTLHRHETVIR